MMRPLRLSAMPALYSKHNTYVATPGNGLNPRILALIAAAASPLGGPLELQDAGSFFVGGR